MTNIIVTEEDGWARIKMDRPEKRNALNQAMRLDLIAALGDLRGRARAIVLTGAETWFCCGADVKERAAFLAEGRADDAGAEGIAVVTAIREYPGVVIAAVNGLALGYGVTLVNAADLAFAAEGAQFGLPELRQGGFASMSIATSLLSGISRKRLGAMIYDTAPIDAQTALAWGLINEIVPSDLNARAAGMAAKIAGFDPVVLAETKAAFAKLPEIGPEWEAALAFGQTVGASIKAKKNGAR